MSRSVMFVVALGTLGFVFDSATIAQIVSFDDGVHVRAPFVTVDVSPRVGVSVRAPYTAVDVAGTPPVIGPGPVIVGRPILNSGLPLPQELAAMDDFALRQTTRAISDRLNARLARFNTGDTWQRYLRLPEEIVADAVPANTSRLDAIANLLDRFQSIAKQPQYSMIAKLPEFAAMQTALSEMLARSDTTVPPPAVHEELPTPAAPLPPPATTTEKSVLNGPAK